MTGPLTEQLRKEHAKLMPHVEELRVIADDAPEMTSESLRDRLCGEFAFFIHEFVPHMDIEQHGWFPAIELLVERGDALAPMAHAHDDIRRLIDALGRSCEAAAASGSTWVLDARRTLYQLYALLKVHLAEEELEAPLLEAELSEKVALGLAARLEFGEPPART